jgi:hypothetical protein
MLTVRLGERVPEHLVVISSDAHPGADLYGYKPYLVKVWHDEFEVWDSTYGNPWKYLDHRSEDEECRIASASADSVLSWDSELRVKNTESEGIAAEVIFPNTAMPFVPDSTLSVPRPKNRDEYEHRWAGLKAHNRWLVDFCAEYPSQWAGVAEILLYDVDDAVEEVRAIHASAPSDGRNTSALALGRRSIDERW